MAGSLTLVAQGLSLDWMFSTSSPTRPTSWYLALHTGANGGAGASNEIVGNGYTRQAVTFTRVNNVVSNSGALTFGPDSTVAWGNVTDITVWDAPTGGRCLAQGPATAPVSYGIGDSATFAAGAFTIQQT